MKSIKVRKNIIKTAAKLFYDKGYNSTGINEIIKKSGIAKATLYNHFNSKENLCIAYLKYQNEKFIAKMNSFNDGLALTENKILALFDFLTEFFNSTNFNGCFLINIISEIQKDDLKIRKEIKIQKNKIFKQIKKATNDTYISNTERENKLIATQVFLLFESALVESHLYQEDWPIISAKEMCVKLIKI